MPAFSARASGIASSASAILIVPRAEHALPYYSPTVLIRLLIYISELHRPRRLQASQEHLLLHIRASWTERSASSTTLCEPPGTSIVTALGFLHPSINTHLSVSTLRSSTRSANPRSLSTEIVNIVYDSGTCSLR